MGHSHDHQHDHAHHDHHHHELPKKLGKAFVLAIVLNTLFVFVEFIYGWLANSAALMADAGHNLSDVLGLLVAWGATFLVKKIPDSRYTYGWRGASIMAALLNAVILLLACGAILWEAFDRLISPPVVASTTVMVVAAIGIVINGFSAWLFASNSDHDINIRGAYLHMLADALVSVGVVISAFGISLTGWNRIDPILSVVIVAVIVKGTWKLLTESLQMAMQSVPLSIDLTEVSSTLAAHPGVRQVYDLHVWPVSTTEVALTAKLVMPDGGTDEDINQLSLLMKSHFQISHVTLQLERASLSTQCVFHEEGHSHDHQDDGHHPTHAHHAH